MRARCSIALGKSCDSFLAGRLLNLISETEKGYSRRLQAIFSFLKKKYKFG